MKILYRNEYIFVSGGATGCKDCDDMELEKECRDDRNTGFAMGAVVGALVSKNPVGMGGASLVGGAIAAKISPECQALVNSKK